MKLDTALYINGARLWTPTAAQNVDFSQGRRGCSSAFANFPGTLQDAFRLRNHPGIMELLISDGARVVWRGRVEDRTMSDSGLSVSAFGYSRMFNDAPYTALWSASTSASWRETTEEEISVSANGRYKPDNNNRIKIAVSKGSETSTDARGVMASELPDRGERNLSTVSFDYTATAFAGAQYIAVLRGYNDAWTQLETQTIVTTTTTATSTFSHTFANANVTKVAILWSRNSATAQEYTGETDEEAVFIATNVRLKTTSAANVLSSSIADSLYAYTNALNPGTLQGRFITATTQDLLSELYEDEPPASILSYLAVRELYDWGVNAERVFFFRPRDSVARDWYVDAAGFQVQESVNALTNSVYATYLTVAGRTMRTATASDALNIQSYGLTRRRMVSAQTTSAAEADVWRDAALADGIAYALRATVKINRITDRGGAERPAYDMLPGDNLIISGLPQTLSPDIDSLSNIRLARVEYNADSGTVSVESDSPIPTLVTLIARR